MPQYPANPYRSLLLPQPSTGFLPIQNSFLVDTPGKPDSSCHKSKQLFYLSLYDPDRFRGHIL